MLHSIVLEKERAPVRPVHTSEAEGATTQDVHDFVYMVIPMLQGYRVMRAPLDRFLEIAEPVSEIPREAAANEATLITENEVTLNRARRFQLSVKPAESSDDQARKFRFAGVKARFGSIEIDGASRVVMRGGKAVQLAPLEFDLLLALYIRNGAAVSRHDLLGEVWSGRKGVTSRTVDTHVFNLRRKLERNPGKPEHLLTVSKVGYRLKT